MTTCKVCGETTMIPDDLEDTGVCNLCAQEDARRLDWLELQRGHVRGTDFPIWSVKGFKEDRNFGDEPGDLTIRQAIDHLIRQEEGAK